MDSARARRLLSGRSLILLTTAVLVLLGAVSVAGIYLYQSQASGNPGWTDTAGYAEYVDLMNGAATPFVAGVMVLLTLCIPRRLLRKPDLVKVAGGVLGMSVAVGVPLGLVTGLTVLLSATAGVQLVSLLETLRGAELSYRKKGHVAHVGSALLHLGVVLLLLDLTAVPKRRALHLPFFWLSTGLFMLGMTLCFYPGLGRVVTERV